MKKKIKVLENIAEDIKMVRDNCSELLALPEYRWVKEDLLPAYYVLSKMGFGLGNGYQFLPTSEENLLINLKTKRALSELREVEQVFADWIDRERIEAVYNTGTKDYGHKHHSGDAHEIRINITGPLLNIGKEQFTEIGKDLKFDSEIKTIYDLFFFKYLLSNANVAALEDTGLLSVITKDEMWKDWSESTAHSAKSLVRNLISCNKAFLSDAVIGAIASKLMRDREIFYEFMDSIPGRYKVVEHHFNSSSCYLHNRYAISSEAWSGISAKIEDIDYVSIIKPSLTKLEEEYRVRIYEIGFLELLKQERVDANNPMKRGDYELFSDVIKRLYVEGFIKISPIEDIILSEEGRKTIDDRINSLRIEVTEMILSWLNEPVKHGNPSPKLKVSSNSYDFGDVRQGDTPSKTFMVENAGGGTLNWEVSDFPDWLEVSTTSGTNDGSFTVTVRSDASIGDYDGTVVVISNAGSEAIDVSGHIMPRGGVTPPPPSEGSIIIGNKDLPKQWGVIGRSIDNRKVIIDLNAPHVVFVCGKMGTGKGYLIGVISEMISRKSIENLSVVENPATIIVFHNPKESYIPSEFCTIGNANDDQKEIELLSNWNYSPKKLFNEEEIKVFMDPKVFDAYEEIFKEDYQLNSVSPISIDPSTLESDDWKLALCIGEGGQQYTKRIFKVFRDLLGQKFGINDIRQKIEQDDKLNENQKKLADGRLEVFEDYFGNEDFMDEIALGGINIFDFRKAMYEPDDIFSIMTIIVSRLQNRKKIGNYPFVFVINEAHTYLDPKKVSDEFIDNFINIIKRKRFGGNWLLLDTHEPRDVHNKLITLSDIKAIFRPDIALSSPELKRICDQSKIKPIDLDDGEAIIRAGKSSIGNKPIVVKIRPRLTKHGAPTKTAL